MKAPILGYPLPKGQFTLDTDASNHGIGAVLSQLQDGQERVLAYYSRALSHPERQYCVTRKELLHCDRLDSQEQSRTEMASGNLNPVCEPHKHPVCME